MKEFVRLANGSPIGYNADKKEQFAKQGKVLLRRIAAKLELPKGSYDIRYNAGGIAVSGDVTLHSNSLYIQFSQSALGPDYGFMFRHVKSRKDYTGGRNNWMRWEQLLDLDTACEIFKKVSQGGPSQENDWSRREVPMWGLSGP